MCLLFLAISYNTLQFEVDMAKLAIPAFHHTTMPRWFNQGLGHRPERLMNDQPAVSRLVAATGISLVVLNLGFNITHEPWMLIKISTNKNKPLAAIRSVFLLQYP